MDGAADVLAATAHAKLALSGERARLKRRAREQLQEAGWTDELRELCREHAARCGAAALTHEALVAQVRAAGLARVPDHLKADLLARLRAALEAE